MCTSGLSIPRCPIPPRQGAGAAILPPIPAKTEAALCSETTTGRAAHFLVTTVEEVPDDAWEKPALGVWTVRDLVGHATRALLTVEAYSERPAESRVVSGPADYFMRALGMLANHVATDQRGRGNRPGPWKPPKGRRPGDSRTGLGQHPAHPR